MAVLLFITLSGVAASIFYLVLKDITSDIWAVAASIVIPVTMGGLGIWIRFFKERGLWPYLIIASDGVVVAKQFIAFSRMNAVAHEMTTVWELVGEDRDRELRYVWSVYLSTKDGDVGVYSGRHWEDTGDPYGAEMARAINASLDAWRDGQISEVLALARRQRTGLQWIEALRRLGSSANDSYRNAPLNVARLSALLDARSAKPSARAAASIALLASGDTDAPQKLAVAAELIANPRIRVALHEIAQGSADSEVAAALEALDEMELEAEEGAVSETSTAPKNGEILPASQR